MVPLKVEELAPVQCHFPQCCYHVTVFLTHTYSKNLDLTRGTLLATLAEGWALLHCVGVTPAGVRELSRAPSVVRGSAARARAEAGHTALSSVCTRRLALIQHHCAFPVTALDAASGDKGVRARTVTLVRHLVTSGPGSPLGRKKDGPAFRHWPRPRRVRS